jgi:hypothetical protein
LGFADSERIFFTITSQIKGDCNVDGVFSVSDAVMLQKWLLNVPRAKISDWVAADLNERR